MAILIYRLSFNNGPFQAAIAARALSSDATINNANAFLAPIVAFDITSTNAEDTDGTNLDPFMEDLGFTRVTDNGSKVLDDISYWGQFDVVDAPSEHVEAGNKAFCNDGFAGEPGPVWYDGDTWRNDSDRSLISNGTGVNVASVNNAGLYVGADGDYVATQASTSGSGVLATFIVTITAGVVASVASITNRGYDYAASDTITLTVIGITETTAAVLNVDSIT